MAINYTKITSGDSFDAASLNDRFTTLQSSINDLTKSDVSRGTFGRDHLPSLVTFADDEEIVVTGGTPYHQYTRTSSAYPGWAGSATAWTTIDSSGEGGGGTDLEVDGFSIDPTDTRFSGIIVMANIQVRAIYDFTAAAAGPPTVPVAPNELYGVFALQAYAGSSWYTIFRSIRYIRGQSINGMTDSASARPARQQNIWFDVSIRSLVIGADVGNNTITKIRAVTGVAKSTAGGTAANHRLRLNRSTLSVIALRGSLS